MRYSLYGEQLTAHLGIFAFNNKNNTFFSPEVRMFINMRCVFLQKELFEKTVHEIELAMIHCRQEEPDEYAMSG